MPLKIFALVGVIGVFYAGLTATPIQAAGASSDFGKSFCSYLKTRAMTAGNASQRKKLMSEYRRCLKEHGEG